VSEIFKEFYEKTGKKIHLEMEPGKYLTINACSMITQIQDIVSTKNFSPTLSYEEREQSAD